MWAFSEQKVDSFEMHIFFLIIIILIFLKGLGEGYTTVIKDIFPYKS